MSVIGDLVVALVRLALLGNAQTTLKLKALVASFGEGPKEVSVGSATRSEPSRLTKGALVVDTAGVAMRRTTVRTAERLARLDLPIVRGRLSSDGQQSHRRSEL